MPDDDPLDDLDRDLGIAVKLAALPILLNMLLGMLVGLLREGCLAVLFVGFVILLYAVTYPIWTLVIAIPLVGLAVYRCWAEAVDRSRQRPRGPQRGGTRH